MNASRRKATKIRRASSYSPSSRWRTSTGQCGRMLIITAPGQGAQTPGFLAPWLELPGVAERLGAASELAGCDLIRFGTTASADEIRDTAVAQPLLVAAAIAAAAVLAGSDLAGSELAGSELAGSELAGGDPGHVPADAAAGHSVGELAAGVLAGVLTAD